jgi:hypothetical protein
MVYLFLYNYLSLGSSFCNTISAMSSSQDLQRLTDISTLLTLQPAPDAGLVPIPNGTQDQRSDEQIAFYLQSYHEVTSDKNVWAFWHSGWSNMAPWSQRNVINWVRRLGPDWSVRVLDWVDGSPVNISRFVDASFFPEAFNKKSMTGPHIGQHSADLIRLPCLYLYGGLWMDVGMLLFRHIDDICWKEIEDPASPYEMAGFLMPLRPNVGTMLNGFIATKRHNGFVKRWHDTYVEMWRGANSSDGFHAHPLLRHLPPLTPQMDELDCPDLSISMAALADYLAHFLVFERLRYLEDPSDGFNGCQYFENKIFLLNAVQETYYAQKLTEWDGAEQFDLLATRYDSPLSNSKDRERYNQAKKFVEGVLANSATMKLSHGPPNGKQNLATLWDMKENSERDIEDGTFAAYLRYGSVNYNQTRKLMPTKIVPTNEKVHKSGILEEIDPTKE